MVTVMFDTVRFYSPLIDEVTARNIYQGLDGFSESGDKVLFAGFCGSMRVVVFNNRALSLQGSLSKYYFNSNIYTPNQNNVQEAIESLSGRLGLDFGDVSVTRLDVASVIVTEHIPRLYYSSMVEKPYFERLQLSENSLLYKTQRRDLSFYDKGSQLIKDGQPIPPEYEGKNLLRYEMRLRKRPVEQLGLQRLTGKDLYSKEVYQRAVRMWLTEFESISKSNKLTMITQDTKHTVKSVRDLFLARAVQSSNRQEDIMRFIDELKEQNVFSDRKNYTRLKKELCSYFALSTGEGAGYIEELETKIKNTAKEQCNF